jgi:hypothetical protein
MKMCSAQRNVGAQARHPVQLKDMLPPPAAMRKRKNPAAKAGFPTI